RRSRVRRLRWLPRSCGARPRPGPRVRASGSSRRPRRRAPADRSEMPSTGHPPVESTTTRPYSHSVPIRVAVAEDEYLVREGLRRLLDSHDDVVVVAACEDLDSLLEAVETEKPDVVVTDIRMPPGGTDEGIQAAARLRETHPN